MTSVSTPLQLTLVSQLLQNLGLNSLPTSLTSALSAYSSTQLISALTAGLINVRSLGNQTLFDSARTIGISSVPALGNSIPVTPTYTNFNNYYFGSNGFEGYFPGVSNFVLDLGNAYLGAGSGAKFAAGFSAVFGYRKVVNQFITTAVNSTDYLGPTFKSMDSLTTSNISQVNAVFDKFGLDIQRQGRLVDTSNLEMYGTPAALVQQISKVAGIGNQTLPALKELFQTVGMSDKDIQNLVTDNRVSLQNPNGLTDNQFDTLQKQAYNALTLLSGDALAQVLQILDVTTPDITSGDQLFDPQSMFPLSYETLTTPTPTGPAFIYQPDGSVNQNIVPIVNSYLPTASGCDELGKIIPPPNAIANKAIQTGLQNVSGIADVSWPEFGEAVYSNTPPWDPTQEYLPNEVVSNPTPSDGPGTETRPPLTNYQSQQYVPAGTDINNTDYWKPLSGGNLQTMKDLPLIQVTPTPVPAAVATYFDTEVAIGSGAYGTITMLDILGLSLDIHNVAQYFSAAAGAINAIAATAVPEYTALLNAYNSLAAATTAGDVTLAISAANTAINDLVANYPSPSPIAGYIATLNTAWPNIFPTIDYELGFQYRGGINYFTMLNGENASVYSFVNLIPQFAQDQVPDGAWDLLTRLFNTTTLGGQAGVAALRESYNLQRLDAVGIRTDATKIPVGAVPGGSFVTPPTDPALFENFPTNRLEV